MIDKISSIETEIVNVLRTIYDPEIPVNIFDLGLIYEIDVDKDLKAKVTMTLTAPNCPMADDIVNEVQVKVAEIAEVKGSEVNLVFEPPWDKSMMTEEAMLELGLL